MSRNSQPPWQKNVSNVIPANFQQQMSIQQFQNQQQQLNMINAAFQQQQQFQTYNPIQIYQPTNNRVNAMAFQQQHQPPQAQQQQQQSNPATQQQPSTSSSKYNANLKSFSGTGIVSKIQNDIGFIDDEVLFHKNVCVKGLSPKLGDRVLVEAAFNQNLPFKWNATRVQVLTRTNASSANNAGDSKSYNQHDGGVGNNNDSYRSRRYSPADRDRRVNDRRPRSRDTTNTDDENERKRRREDRDRVRTRESVEYSRDRTKSPIRRAPSPKRRRAHNIPRYMVQIPKISLSLANIDILEIKKRYPNLYIPSDFTVADNKWMNAFPFHKPYSIQKPCTFHIMKDVNPIDESISQCVLDPPDADYSFSAKVMLLSIPAIHEVYKRCIVRAEDSEKHDDSDKDFIHPSRLISFLVGVRGKNETMAIGGPWSKKLDGENPESDPSVLIRTAIRTCKALTGIDLSNCTQWYRFVELKYRRSEQNKKDGSDGSVGSGGKASSARIETVVIFLPDVHSCMPNRTEWDGVQQQYKMALEKFLSADNDIASNSVNKGGSSDVEIITSDDQKVNAAEQKESNDDVVMADEEQTAEVAANDISIDVNKADGEEDEQKSETSELDPKNMKVTELRAELAARNLPTKGLKNELVDRLTTALQNPDSVEIEQPVEIETEVEEEKKEPVENQSTTENKDEPMEQDDEVKEVVADTTTITTDESTQKDQEIDMNIAEMDISEVTVIDEYDSKCDEQEEKLNKKKAEPKKMDEKEKHMWERRYQLPENPHVVVHPSKTAKNGKFDCTVVSLSLLLDYRKDDSKEHSFEIALFAEAFNEMLMRDFGYNIYKAFNYFSITKAKESGNKEDDKDKKEVTESVDNEKSNDASEQDNEGKDKSKSRKSGEKREDSDDQSDHSRKRGDGKDRAIKYVTAFPDLLLSFNYFDQTQCGYIFEKDLEELFFCLGLNLSRSQVRKLTEKFITRDSLYYRKLTDRVADAPSLNPYENVTDEQLAALAQGNRPLSGIQTSEIVSQSNSNIVMYEGATINLQQVMHQMKRTEAAYEENEKLLVDIKKSNSELKSLNHKNEKRIKDLNSDLKGISRKLQDAESSLSSVTRKYNECYSTITSINERIAPVIARNERSRDREKDKSDRKSDKSAEKKPKDEVSKSSIANANEKSSTEKSTVKVDKKEVKEEAVVATIIADKEIDAKESEIKQEAVLNE